MGLPAQLEGLKQATAYPHPVQRIEVVETHVSWIVLTGDYSYKIKRPVHLPFLDATRLERRHELCEEEVRLNRRLAPEIYLGVCAITSTGDGVRVGATVSDEPVEYAVRMRQFDRACELDRLVSNDQLTAEELVVFGTELATWHRELPPLPDASTYDDPDTVAKLIATNARECADALRDVGLSDRAMAIGRSMGEYLGAHRDTLAERARVNTFRECHGDLHLSNLVRIGKRVIAFDCLEFERSFRCIDVADEVSFLYADLEASQRPDLAQYFLNAYLARSGDFGLCSVLNLYAAHRGLVMAKTSALRKSNAAVLDRYLCTAEAALARPRPLCIVMCGLSGSGKSWLASRVAPLTQAVHVRSDVERKRAAGLDPTESSHSGLDSDLYDTDHTRQTYARLEQCARRALDGRCNVILDATFLKEAQRAQMRAVAEACEAHFVIVRCIAAEDTLERRLIERSNAKQDASEADVAVMKRQLTSMEGLTTEERLNLIEVSTADPQAVSTVAAALRDLRDQSPQRGGRR